MLRKERLPLVALAMLALIGGLLAGLQRIGWSLPFTVPMPDHGAIMVGGFLGTLIALEKIIPLKRVGLYLIPVVSGSSIFFFFAGFPTVSLVFLVIASVGLTVVFGVYWFRERSVIYALMLIGALCWLTGNALLLITGIYPFAISWWMAFVLLIITTERLDLTKFLPVTTSAKLILVSALGVFVIGCILSFHGAGSYVASFALIVVSVWLLCYDIIGINLKKEGLSRFVALALLCGYAVLMLTGFLLPGIISYTFGYDIIIHSFFIGFVFSMIFAHGPVILPGVLGIPVKPFHPVLYGWLLVLHLSWILRLLSDLVSRGDMRKYSGLVSAVAIIGYFITLAMITIRANRVVQNP